MPRDHQHQPVVSFVVLCYNTEPYAGDCIRSILALDTDVPFEIIALDDHSADGTHGVLQSFNDPRLRVIRNEKNMGHALAMEIAIRETSGALLARIDSDDRYRPHFLKRTLPIFEMYREVGMVYGDASMIGPLGQEYAPRCDRQHGGRDFKGCELVDLLEWNFICAPTIIARRDLILRHLPIPPHLAFSDWYFTVSMARETEFYYIDSVIADYRVHPGNMHSRTILDRTEEKSIFWFLDQVYGSRERISALQHQKLLAKRKVYGQHYLTLADKYFGAYMTRDARRCYWEAVKCNPKHLIAAGVARRFSAALLGREMYERVKQLMKGNRVKSGVGARAR
jgi:glycosyltransferase involved in cell wall biosynthesis